VNEQKDGQFAVRAFRADDVQQYFETVRLNGFFRFLDARIIDLDGRLRGFQNFSRLCGRKFFQFGRRGRVKRLQKFPRSARKARVVGKIYNLGGLRRLCLTHKKSPCRIDKFPKYLNFAGFARAAHHEIEYFFNNTFGLIGLRKS